MSVATMPRDSSAAPQTGRAARLAARTGEFKGATAGVALSAASVTDTSRER